MIRRGLGEQFKIGLVRYAARTSARDRLRVTYTAPTSTAGAAPKPDPWNFWVFTFGLNGNSFGESSTSNLFLSGNFNDNRTTDAWKLSIGTNFNRQRNRYTLSDRKVIAIVKNFGGNTQWRVFRGFSLNFNGNYTRVWDQLFIAKGALSDDEILTRQRQLATGYRYNFFFGINYRFGSTLNSVVNPRFGPDNQFFN